MVAVDRVDGCRQFIAHFRPHTVNTTQNTLEKILISGFIIATRLFLEGVSIVRILRIFVKYWQFNIHGISKFT